jgi:hypothetical protein
MGSASGAAHFVGYVLPAASGGEDEPNDFEDDAVVDVGSAALGSDGLLRWQVVADEVIEVIGHVSRSHSKVPPGEE